MQYNIICIIHAICLQVKCEKSLSAFNQM